MISSAIEHDVGQGSAVVSFGCLCHELNTRLQESTSLPNRSETLQCDFSWYQGGLSLLASWIGDWCASRSLETWHFYAAFLFPAVLFRTILVWLGLRRHHWNSSEWAEPPSRRLM